MPKMARLPQPAQTLAFGLKIARLFGPSVNFTGFSHTICLCMTQLFKAGQSDTGGKFFYYTIVETCTKW